MNARMLSFEKYHGAGNDFVMIDGRSGEFDDLENSGVISRVCARHTGVGADGLIVLKQVSEELVMVYYNSDGAPSSFCGNGSRCFIKYVVDLGLVPQGEYFSFQANDGRHQGYYGSDEDVRVSMLLSGDVKHYSEEVDLVDTGSPHYVSWCEVLPKGDIIASARQIRYGAAFAKTGINVNYVSVLTDDSLAIRTYERGVENETLACGTGVTAAALSFAERRQLQGKVDIPVRALGGSMRVRFWRKPDGEVSDLVLEGPARRVYTGSIGVEALG